MKRRNISKPGKRQNQGRLGKGFTVLGDFQIKQTGKVAGKFDANALKVGPQKAASSETRLIALKDLDCTTRIINPTLRAAVSGKKIYATRASLIQDLLNRGIIGQGSVGDLMYLNKMQFETEVRKILAKS